MIDRSKYARQLPDGTDVCGTLTAAAENRMTPAGFLLAARRHKLRRFAAKGRRGSVTHYWVVDEVEDLAAERFNRSVVLESDDEFVEIPFEAEAT